MINSVDYYIKGAKKLAKSVAMPDASPALQQARLQICNACNNKQNTGRCICENCMKLYGKAHEHCEMCCGCYVQSKVKLSEEYCPQNKW